MCLLFMELWNNPESDGFRLILASNRDEFYRRPAANAHEWEEAKNIFGGRDMEPGREGGTWLAMDSSGFGRIGALLNVMGGPSSKDARGRGPLVTEYLLGSKSADDYMAEISERGQEYNSFHLLTVDLNPTHFGAWHYSNRSPVDGAGTKVSYKKEGKISLGNSLSDSPFRKVTEGAKRFQRTVEEFGKQGNREKLVDELVEILKWNHKHVPDEELELRGARANLTSEARKLSSSVFQRLPEYGTRTHTVILVDSDWRCDFHEWTLSAPVDPDTSEWIHTHKIFQLNKSS